MEAGLLPVRNDRRKVNSFRLRLRNILAAFQPFKGLARYSRRPSPEDILKCCICASVRPFVGNVHDRMPALLREMDFRRWLSDMTEWCVSIASAAYPASVITPPA